MLNAKLCVFSTASSGESVMNTPDPENLGNMANISCSPFPALGGRSGLSVRPMCLLHPLPALRAAVDSRHLCRVSGYVRTQHLPPGEAAEPARPGRLLTLPGWR